VLFWDKNKKKFTAYTASLFCIVCCGS